MDKNLPARPNLDHLRRQAKSLLSALEAGESNAVSTFLEHLPAAKGMSADQVRGADLRLADAQSAIARKSGFASWPQLARHVDQLRALEGTWAFASLEIEGNTIPAGGLQSSRLLIDGDRFRCESPEANYEGVFNIDVEAQPHQIEIEFVEGPEAGNWNFGIFRIDGDRLEICLDVNGKPCPKDFRTSPGSGHALETLMRTSTLRPESVDGGAAPGSGGAGSERAASPTLPREGPASSQESPGFECVSSATLTRLQGEWIAEKLVRDGQEFPAMMCDTGRRSANGNEVRITFGGQLIIHALTRLHEATDPVQIDYYHLAGTAKGELQHGIMQWRGEVACFCMGAPGGSRPTDFACPVGSGHTLSHWRPKK